MNERIDNLLWQAGGYTKLNYPNDTFLDGRYALTQLQLDKFAELLVKECMKLCTEVKEDLVGIVDNDKRDLAEMGVTFCYEAIKSEFGVEE